MSKPLIPERAASFFEAGVVAATQLFLMAVLAVAVLITAKLAWIALPQSVGEIEDVTSLEEGLKRAFSSALLVLLGLELLETMRTYLAERRVRLEVVLIVAAIAVGRHVVLLDFHHASGTQLAGMGALLLALTGGCFLMGRAQSASQGT